MRNAPNHRTLDFSAKWPTNKTMVHFSLHTFNTWNTTILSVQYINVSPFNWWYEKEQKKLFSTPYNTRTESIIINELLSRKLNMNWRHFFFFLNHIILTLLLVTIIDIIHLFSSENTKFKYDDSSIVCLKFKWLCHLYWS